jgi:uncharacterized membrane protein
VKARKAPDWLQRRPDPAWLICGLITAIWAGVFIELIIQRHQRFATFDFDLGIHTQAIWLMTHEGHGFLTVRGLPALGHHATFGYWLLAPLAWLGAGANTWNVLHTLSLAAIAPLLFAFGRAFKVPKWLALVVPVMWLAHPFSQSLVWETFHPDVMVLPWLLAAALFAVRKQWRACAMCAVMAMSWKEDAAIAVIMLGLVVLLSRDWRKSWKPALALMVGGGAWFVLAALVMMPHLNGGATHAGTFYGELGSSLGEVFVNIFRKPDVVLDHLRTSNPFGIPTFSIGGLRIQLGDGDVGLGYVWKVWWPFAFVLVLAPRWLLIGLPMLVINLLSTAYFVYDPKYHYVALPLLAAAMASAAAMGIIAKAATRLANNPRWRNVRVVPLSMAMHSAVAALMLLVAVLAHHNYGYGPWTQLRHSGYWGIEDRIAVKEAALDFPEGDDAVAADYSMVPHLSNRRRVYTFPNPWDSLNWGVKGENPDTTDGITWIIIDRGKVAPEYLKIFDRLIKTGDYTIVMDIDSVQVAKLTSQVQPDKTSG